MRSAKTIGIRSFLFGIRDSVVFFASRVLEKSFESVTKAFDSFDKAVRILFVCFSAFGYIYSFEIFVSHITSTSICPPGAVLWRGCWLNPHRLVPRSQE